MKTNKFGFYAVAVFAVVFLIIFPIKYYYFEIYKLKLNGVVDNIEIDIKEAMDITISKEKHNFGHHWPIFQEKVSVGDSVYKKPNEYDIILIKKGTKERILCHYE